MPEIVEEGRTGFVFRSEDSTALADILQAEIDRGWRAAEFSTACVQASKQFSVQKIFDEYMRVWETAVRTQSPGSNAPVSYAKVEARKAGCA
jgi:glycosyltransferase involved in cell wall biosynthesis